jgi:hypothetical protein
LDLRHALDRWWIARGRKSRLDAILATADSTLTPEDLADDEDDQGGDDVTLTPEEQAAIEAELLADDPDYDREDGTAEHVASVTSELAHSQADLWAALAGRAVRTRQDRKDVVLRPLPNGEIELIELHDRL